MTNYINYKDKLLIVGDEVLPIVHWSQGKNEDCKLEDAWGCVAGPTKDGQWIVQPLNDDVKHETMLFN